ncbi:hypothetical protein AVEN_239868-1 [Araneus ventricosus]|uniref:Uncharacterized protein n=1 Tax=Araneus ventricosus TaxID=182803 RepID=A0A4Y2F8D5_ARAVE|nr:hypothetical protein AVEN_239868-1 [Araneus ventricosus]
MVINEFIPWIAGMCFDPGTIVNNLCSRGASDNLIKQSKFLYQVAPEAPLTDRTRPETSEILTWLTNATEGFQPVH